MGESNFITYYAEDSRHRASLTDVMEHVWRRHEGCLLTRGRLIQRCRRLSLRLPMGMQEAISTKLIATFAPLSLKVLDESYQHEGHAGHRPGGETHFRIYIVAEAFRGKSRIVRHRMINETLADELKSGVHALAIHAAAPDERL